MNNWGSRHTVEPSVPAQGNKVSNPLAVKFCGVCGGRRNCQSHKRVCCRGPQDPRTYTSPPTQESAPERAQCTCGKWGKWLKGEWELSKPHCSLSDPSPTHSVTVQRYGVPCPGEYLRFLHPYNITSPPRQRNMAWMKEQMKTVPEKELSDEEMANYQMQSSKHW